MPRIAPNGYRDTNLRCESHQRAIVAFAQSSMADNLDRSGRSIGEQLRQTEQFPSEQHGRPASNALLRARHSLIRSSNAKAGRDAA
jgi:hypothetical protein